MLLDISYIIFYLHIYLAKIIWEEKKKNETIVDVRNLNIVEFQFVCIYVEHIGDWDESTQKLFKFQHWYLIFEKNMYMEHVLYNTNIFMLLCKNVQGHKMKKNKNSK